ncbi:MAG: PIG-L family deacetylase, partial [Acidobacteriota bacterium]
MRRVVLALAAVAAVLVAWPEAHSVPQDTGAAGAWQKIQKARTTTSVMHTTAHPDDEHGGVITRLSRKDGARLALMTLTRGESGDNAIGSQLFDGLGLIRTEELRLAGKYYGLDEQYFTTVVDYGFSKRLEEAFEKWGKEAVLRDVVRVIRTSRPFVL